MESLPRAVAETARSAMTEKVPQCLVSDWSPALTPTLTLTLSPTPTPTLTLPLRPCL